MFRAIQQGGCYIVTPLTDQIARILCVEIGESCVLTAGEWFLFRRDNEAVEKWVEALDGPS
jgi:hypothetical protein